MDATSGLLFVCLPCSFAGSEIDVTAGAHERPGTVAEDGYGTMAEVDDENRKLVGASDWGENPVGSGDYQPGVIAGKPSSRQKVETLGQRPMNPRDRPFITTKPLPTYEHLPPPIYPAVHGHGMTPEPALDETDQVCGTRQGRGKNGSARARARVCVCAFD